VSKPIPDIRGSFAEGAWDYSDLSVHFIDDYRSMHLTMRSMLLAMRIRDFSCFNDPRESIERMEVRIPDLIITDYYMSPIDGIDFTRMIRKENACADEFVPIILLTGYATPRLVERARDNGVLAKPLSIKLLYRRITAIVEENRSFIQGDEYFGPDRRRKERIFDGPDKRMSNLELQTVA
jgi:two-component system chemotaxis response regulator CheY